MSAGGWWIEAQGRAWGPYPADRLPRFRDEGRLGPASRVSRSPDGPFAPAAEALAGLFGAAGASEPASVAVEDPAGDRSSSEAASTGWRTLLVFADAAEVQLAAFEAQLARHGDSVRVRPGLWLLRASEGAGPLRNALSRGLDTPATLLIAEAPLTAAAWFNLDGDTDRALRGLWGRA